VLAVPDPPESESDGGVSQLYSLVLSALDRGDSNEIAKVGHLLLGRIRLHTKNQVASGELLDAEQARAMVDEITQPLRTGDGVRDLIGDAWSQYGAALDEWARSEGHER
jgi:hypothetical protein